MNSDFIRSFIKYKIRRLSEYASFFFMDYDQELMGTCLRTYFETYTNTYFYHVLGTLDEADDFGFSTIQAEFEGIKEELLDEYKDLEFVIPNLEYERNKVAISEMVQVALFICHLDQIRFTSKGEILEQFNEFIEKYPQMKVRLGSNSSKLIAKIKENENILSKVFNEEKEYFKIDHTQTLKKDSLYYVKLDYNIRTLQSNYKKSMVERVYADDRFTIEKLKNIFWKLPRELMRKFIYQEKIGKYVIVLDDKMFQRGNIDLFRMIDNPFLKRYLVLAVSFNSYTYHKDFLEYLGFKVGCYQDMKHIGEVLDKLNSIDAEKFFDYIFISDYKEKDKEVILGWECSPGVELYITKEE